MEIHTDQPADLSTMRDLLNHQGYGEVSLQNIGTGPDSANNVLIRIQVAKDEEQNKIIAQVKDVLTSKISGTIDYHARSDYVGPTIGQGADPERTGIWAVLLSFATIKVIYVWFRFRIGSMASCAILALRGTTAIMVIGFFAVNARFEFGLTAVAAILTIVGYSINDSVVIYDRIRENMRRFKKMDTEALLNLFLINSRYAVAHGALPPPRVMLTSLSLALFGGEVLRAAFPAALVFPVLPSAPIPRSISPPRR